jgi:hypothetical protein
VITPAFYYVFSTTCAHSHLRALPVKHLPFARAMSQTVSHYTMTSVLFFFREHVLPEFLTLTNYIFSPLLQASLQWTETVPTAKNKALCQRLPIRML